MLRAAAEGGRYAFIPSLLYRLQDDACSSRDASPFRSCPTIGFKVLHNCFMPYTSAHRTYLLNLSTHTQKSVIKTSISGRSELLSKWRGCDLFTSRTLCNTPWSRPVLASNRPPLSGLSRQKRQRSHRIFLRYPS